MSCSGFYRNRNAARAPARSRTETWESRQTFRNGPCHSISAKPKAIRIRAAVKFPRPCAPRVEPPDHVLLAPLWSIENNARNGIARQNVNQTAIVEMDRPTQIRRFAAVSSQFGPRFSEECTEPISRTPRRRCTECRLVFTRTSVDSTTVGNWQKKFGRRL